MDKSLEDLGMDYLDLFLMYWLVLFKKLEENEWIRNLIDLEMGVVVVLDVLIMDIWKVMEEMVRKGKVRVIGVSNFMRERMEEILKM